MEYWPIPKITVSVCHLLDVIVISRLGRNPVVYCINEAACTLQNFKKYPYVAVF